jgi:hypothetical protein
MPNYQVKYRVNSRTYNTDIEARDVNSVIRVFDDLTVSHIEQIKEYKYYGRVDTFEDRSRYTNYTIYFNYKNKESIKISLPKMRKNKKIEEAIAYLKTIYPNPDSINYHFKSF